MRLLKISFWLKEGIRLSFREAVWLALETGGKDKGLAFMLLGSDLSSPLHSPGVLWALGIFKGTWTTLPRQIGHRAGYHNSSAA